MEAGPRPLAERLVSRLLPPARREVIHRWRYVPSLGVFVVAVSIDSDVYFYKTPD